jgi:putative glycosyltransferase
MQTYTNIEVLIVNDGSTDDSAEICKRYIDESGDPRFKLFNKPNGGLADARNYGIAQCSPSSEYVVFVDSDDEIANDCIMGLESVADKDTLVISALLRCSERPSEQYSYLSHSQFTTWACEKFLSKMKDGILNTSCGRCYSLKTIRQHGLKFKNTLPEDTIFNISYIDHCHHIILINVPLYYYFIRPQSMSTKPNEIIFSNYIQIQKKLYQRIPTPYHNYIDEFVYPQYRTNIMKFIHEGDYATPTRYLHDIYVQRALDIYRPVSIADRLLHTCLRKGWLRLAKLF